MKIKTDFTTNSSSSSFIISSKDIDFPFLVKVVLKDFYIALRQKWSDETKEEIVKDYNLDNIIENEDGSLGLFIRSKDEIDEDRYMYVDIEETLYPKNEIPKEWFYIISNNTTCRFDWDIVERIFTDKYNIPWERGYCD